MDFIDLILNLGGLALWVSWRSLGRSVRQPSIATHSLMANLRATQPRQGASRWPHLIGLIALLTLRSFFYHSVGPTVHWAPVLDFGPVGIAFRSDIFWRATLYSLLSFGKFLAIFYLWLMLLSAVNEKAPEYDPIQSWVRVHLGALDRLPFVVKAASPFVVGCGAWAVMSWGFGRAGMAPPATDASQLIKEASILGLCAYLPLKLPLIAIIGVHAVSSYVYLGTVEWLNYIDSTARNLLNPLRWLALGRIDLAPLVGIALVVYAELYGRAVSERAFGLEGAGEAEPVFELAPERDSPRGKESLNPSEFRSEESDPTSGGGE